MPCCGQKQKASEPIEGPTHLYDETEAANGISWCWFCIAIFIAAVLGLLVFMWPVRRIQPPA
jgi:hypothetical protein